MKKTTMMNEGLALGLVGTIGAYLWFSRSKRTASKAKALPETNSPFVAGSNCTQLGDEAQIERWLTSVGEQVEQRIGAFDLDPDRHADGRDAINALVDEVFSSSVPECASLTTRASRQLWKLLWCDVVAELVRRGKIDEELDDVLRLCADPSFDPRTFVKDESKPRPAEPRPLPPRPEPVVEPEMDGASPVPPANVRVASTREELSALGVMRMMQGTIGGAPIKAPSTHTVVLAMSPFWPHLERARATMAQMAAEHPGVSFVEVSFADTQRHFGKPNDVAGLMWALAGAGPDGRAFPSPITRNDPRDGPPSAEAWMKLIGHASGFVGAPGVRRMVRPRRFGDLTRAMVARRRPSVRGSPQRTVRRSSRTRARRGS